MAIETPTERLRREQKRSTSLRRSAVRLGIDPEKFEPESSGFWKLLEPFGRPQMAVFNVVDELQTNPDADVDDVLSRAWHGLDGSDKTYFADILRNAGMQDGTALVTFGFAGDVIFDPLNVLMPYGAMSKLPTSLRKAMLASDRGRKAAYWWTEAWRTKELDPVRRAATRMFAKRADIKGGITGVAGHYSAEAERRAILKEFDEFEQAGFGKVIAERPPELSPKTPFVKPTQNRPRVVADIEAMVAGGMNPEQAAERASSLQRRADLLKTITEAPLKEGKLPHVVLGEMLWKAQRDTRYGAETVASGMMKEMRQFFQEDLKGMAEDDMMRVTHYAEAVGMEPKTLSGRKLRDARMARALDGATDPERVRKSGQKFADMEKARFDLEEKLGLPRAYLGGVFAKQKAEYKALTAKRLEGLEEATRRRSAVSLARVSDELKGIADEFEKVNWGPQNADRDAFVSVVRAVTKKKGGVDAADVRSIRGYMDGLVARAIGGTAVPEATRQGVDKIRKVAALGERRLTAHQKFLEDVLPARIARGRTRILSTFRSRMKQYAELQDRVPAYVRHIVSDEVAERMYASKRMRGSMFSEKHASLLHRAWVDGDGAPLPMEQVERIMKASEAELDGLAQSMLKKRKTLWEFAQGKPEVLGHYYDADPLKLMVLRRQSTVRAVAAKDFHAEMRGLFGSYNGPNGVELPAYGNTVRQVMGKDGAVRTVAMPARFHPELAQALEELSPAYTSPDAARVYQGILDRAQSWWVGTTLLPWPAYHARNFVGNVWNMALGGFFTSGHKIGRFWEVPLDPEAFMDFGRAAKMQTHITSGNEAALTTMKFNLNGVNMNGAEVLDLARRHGVIDHGFATTFFKAAAEQEVKMAAPSMANAKELLKDGASLGAWLTPGGLAKNPVMRLGKEVARGVDNHAKLAFFLNRLRKGDDAIEAASKTARYLFDFSDVTPFHSQILRRWFPFATWTMKNIPAQLRGLLERPTQFTLLEKAGRASGAPGSPMLGVTSALAGQDVEGIHPSERPDALGIPEWMNRMAPVPLGRNADGDIEFGVLRGWIPAADLEAVSNGKTALRTPLDMLTPLLKVPLETAAGYSFFYEKGLKGTSEMFGIQMDARVANALNNLRAVSEFDRLNVLGDAGFSVRRLRPETADTFAQRWMRLWTGIKVYPTDTRRARLTNLREMNSMLSMEVSKERKARSREGQREIQAAWERIWGHRE